MLITPANLNIYFIGLDTRFWTAFESTPVWWNKVATEYTATTDAWMTGWLGMVEKLRVWRGARVLRQPAPNTYMIPILPFELTEEIDRFTLEDDQYGIYTPLIQAMGEQARKWPDYTVRDLIQGIGDFQGQAQIGIDGVTHWNTAHPVDPWDPSKGTYPNDFGTAGVVVNGETVGGSFSINAWATLWQNHTARKHEGGEAIGSIPNLTMVPPQMQFQATALLQSTIFSPPQLGNLGAGAGANAPFVGAMDNPFRGSTDLFINPDLANQPTAYYLLDTRRAVKPFGWILRKAPTMIQRTSPTDPANFDRHAFIYGVEARGAPAWGPPWMSSRSGVAA